jgi:hypothetical protein
VKPITLSVLILAAGCATARSRAPQPLHTYRVLIETHDSLSDYLARALARKGFKVRRHVKGGNPPTAALLTFTFRELSGTPTVWFNARLSDTRSGMVVAAVSVPLDSLGATAALRAECLADSFAARLTSRHGAAP